MNYNMEHKKYIDFLNEVSIRDHNSNWIAILTLDPELITEICTKAAKQYAEHLSNIHIEKVLEESGCGCDYWGDKQYSRDDILEVKFEIP